MPLSTIPPVTETPVPAPNTLDVHVGARLRTRRTFLRISQEKLGEQIGVTFQQVQKYEKGANRVSASQLFQLAGFLKVDVNYFFEGLTNPGFAEAAADLISAESIAEEGVRLNRAFARLNDPRIRKKLIDLVEATADASALSRAS